MPTAVVENRSNGHAHAVWGLSEPVTRTEYARRARLAYAAGVTEGLRRAVDGDKGYSGLMTKNPTHDAWDTHWISTELRPLAALEHALEGHMPPESWRRTRRRNPVGLGRNCTIFETARIWAYRDARRIRQRYEYATPEDSTALLRIVTERVHDLNNEFSEPLPASETKAIATSIHRWITTRFYGWTDARTVKQATFSAIQSARGRRARPARRAASEALWEGA